MTTPEAGRVIRETRAWVHRAVVGLNLCPFAKAPMVKGQIRYTVSETRDPHALLDTLRAQLHELLEADPELVETVLLIHPNVLGNFMEFNDFLDEADALLQELGLEGVLQIASFHPQYQFAGTGVDDLGNASNRSPYPTLHLLREASIDRAVEAFPEAETIYETNVRTLEALGAHGWARLQAQCRTDSAD